MACIFIIRSFIGFVDWYYNLSLPISWKRRIIRWYVKNYYWVANSCHPQGLNICLDITAYCVIIYIIYGWWFWPYCKNLRASVSVLKIITITAKDLRKFSESFSYFYDFIKSIRNTSAADSVNSASCKPSCASVIIYNWSWNLKLQKIIHYNVF